MATRGAKPTPAALRLVEGTHNVTRYGSPDELRDKVEKAAKAFGPLIKPDNLPTHAEYAWDHYLAPATWLDRSREIAALAFVELYQEFREYPQKFQVGKHAQMRAYMAELGLTDERNRGDWEPDAEPDEFFGD